jgi:hypothetical protein
MIMVRKAWNGGSVGPFSGKSVAGLSNAIFLLAMSTCTGKLVDEVGNQVQSVGRYD